MCVVVAFSPTPPGQAALKAAIGLAASRATDLVVVAHSYTDATGERRTAADAEVHAAVDADGGMTGAVEVVRREDEETATVVLSTAAERAAELIVIGIQGSSPTGKLNLGGTARRLVVSSTCPVLAVKDAPTAA